MEYRRITGKSCVAAVDLLYLPVYAIIADASLPVVMRYQKPPSGKPARAQIS